MSDVPVFLFKTENGVDIHFSNEMGHSELMSKVANALAALDFDPQVSVTKPSGVDTGYGI